MLQAGAYLGGAGGPDPPFIITIVKKMNQSGKS